MLARCLTLLLAASLLWSGCGDDDTPERDASTSTTPAGTTGAAAPPTSSTGPDATVRGYFGALAQRDGDRACTLLSRGARRKAIATVEASQRKQFKTCGLALATAVSATSTESLQSLDLEVTKTTVDGDRAKVRVQGGAGEIELRRMAGRWVITGGIG